MPTDGEADPRMKDRIWIGQPVRQ